MTGAILTEKDERLPATGTAHLSFSRINRYLHCPEQYRLYYIENLRRRFPSASLVFGQAVHQALAGLFRAGEDPVRFFLGLWDEVGQMDVEYSSRESWVKLHVAGQKLLEKFAREELVKLEAIEAVEKTFELTITSLDLPFVGIIDLVSHLDGKKTVVDFKTASSAYQEHEVVLSDQLTAYQLAEPGAEQTALCVLVKTKAPQIEWHVSQRGGQQLVEFLAKTEHIAGEIAGGRFYRRLGKWCSWCDYLPVCTRDTQKISETLIRIR